MAVGLVRSIILKRVTQSLFRNLIQGISTTSLKMENALENLAKNPYYEKYANRIAELQKTSPEEFMSRVDHQLNAREAEKRNKFGTVDVKQFSSVLNPKEPLKEAVAAAEKHLSDIFKIELVEDKNGTEIQSIWEEYHKNKEVISAIIPSGFYSEMQDKMKQFPTFVFPLPRSQGYEFIMSQCYGHTVHFTPLLAYQIHKENSPECLTMVHYTELRDKGVILMRGDYDKNVLSGQEAQCLANQFQMYYNSKDQVKLKLLESFTKSPDNFKHMDLITQLETISFV